MCNINYYLVVEGFSRILIGLKGIKNKKFSEPSTHPSWKCWKRQRYVVAIMGFCGFFNVYIIRVNLSIAIVAMTGDRFVKGINGTMEKIGPEFNWPNKVQGHILGSFFWGYICTQFVSGLLASKFGGKLMFGLGVSVPAGLCLITPCLTKVHVYFLIVIRVIQGIFQGVTYPCIHALWSKWAPPLERARLATIAFSGCFVGTVVAMPACAWIADHMGWPWIFYICGISALLWYVLWLLFIAEAPDKDKRISHEELTYIQESLKYSSKPHDSSFSKVPWKKIFTSLPFWAIAVSHFGENWGFYTLLTQMPTFLNDVFQYDLENSGFLSALPYLIMSILIQFSGQLADWFLVKKILTTTQVRKIFNCGAFLAQFIFMLIPAVWSHEIGSVVCLTMSIGLGAFAWSGFSVNYLDLAPPYASLLMGIGNTLGTTPGIISPTITGYIVKDEPTAAQWQIVFYITGVIYLFGFFFYGIFASGELQPWALQDDTT